MPTMTSTKQSDGPLRVVAGVILRDGRVLGARRSQTMAHPGAWEFPGGKVEIGEVDRVALARELHEELGLDVRVGPFVGAVMHAYTSRTVHLVAYQCEVVGGEPVAHEHDELRWLAMDDLAALRWASADLHLLQSVHELLASGGAARP